MRAGQQHVERKIRLWVVQQERVRLINGRRGEIHARAQEPPRAPAPSPPEQAPER